MSDTPPKDPAMADILASIKRIVAEEDRRGNAGGATHVARNGEIMDLTHDMRIDDVPDADSANALGGEAVSAGVPSIDEAAVADIARTVLREELNGQLGLSLTRNIKKLISDEVARAMAARD